MAAESNFIFGDDFDAIMTILEENEELENDFHKAVEEVQREGEVCGFCQKICKTKRGLKRHITVKHKEVREDTGQKITTNNEASESTLTAETLVGMVYDVKKKISEKKVFSDILRDELKSYQYEMDEESSEFSKLKQLYEALIKNGNEEKFFSKYYAEIALNATSYFEGLSRNAATLLSTKLADSSPVLYQP